MVVLNIIYENTFLNREVFLTEIFNILDLPVAFKLYVGYIMTIMTQFGFNVVHLTSFFGVEMTFL